MQFFTLLLATAACFAAVSAQNNQNTYEGMVAKDPTCGTKYQTIAATYYAGTPCEATVYEALDTDVVTNCPLGSTAGTAVGTPVWACMGGSGNNTALIAAWVNFVKNCEIFYIAARTPAGETEGGFSWVDNSCFQRFADLASFQEYLQGTNVDQGNSASSIHHSSRSVLLSLVPICAGVAMMLALLL